MLKKWLIPLLILSLNSCRTVKTNSKEEIHKEKEVKAIKYDSVSTSGSKTTIVEDKSEIKKGEYKLTFKLDTNNVKWDSLWVKNPPKSPLEALTRIASRAKEIEVEGNVNSEIKTITTTNSENKDSSSLKKEDNSIKELEDKKVEKNRKVKGLSGGVIIWGIIIILLVGGLLVLNYYIPILPMVRKLFKK